MVHHFQKRWRLKFRRDPDAGRVLFIGPLVLSLDVHRGERSDRAAYEGAREDLLDWKRRALRAEKDSRRLAIVLDWWFFERPDIDLRQALSRDELIGMLDADHSKACNAIQAEKP